MNISITGFLFGYEDELACITDFSPIQQETDTDDEDQENTDWGDDDWDDDDWGDGDVNDEANETPRSKREIPSYRDPSGKCLWGILRDLNNTEHETIRYINSFIGF